jgi:hypothetical protein
VRCQAGISVTISSGLHFVGVTALRSRYPCNITFRKLGKQREEIIASRRFPQVLQEVMIETTLYRQDTREDHCLPEACGWR